MVNLSVCQRTVPRWQLLQGVARPFVGSLHCCACWLVPLMASATQGRFRSTSRFRFSPLKGSPPSQRHNFAGTVLRCRFHLCRFNDSMGPAYSLSWAHRCYLPYTLPSHRCVYVAPLEAITRVRMAEWSKKFGEGLGLTVVELTGVCWVRGGGGGGCEGSGMVW
jgi:hypothetical protein